ncbi:hypothetical protein HDE_09961 [Halotydeus destructor]|nr:hypothetical protein HDE_09961 [Halotydeus destructor]
MDEIDCHWKKISHDANFQIYQFLSTWDLLAVGATCLQFQELIAHHLKSLKKVDLRLANPKNACKYRDELKAFILTRFGSNLKEMKLNEGVICRQWICEEFPAIYPQIMPEIVSTPDVCGVFLTNLRATFVDHDLNDLTLKRTRQLHYPNLVIRSNMCGVLLDLKEFRSLSKQIRNLTREELATIDTLHIRGIKLGPITCATHLNRFLDMFPSLKTIFILRSSSRSSTHATGAKWLLDYVASRKITLSMELSFTIGNTEMCRILSPFVNKLNIVDGYPKAELFDHHNYFNFKNLKALRLLASQIKNFLANSQFFENHSLKLTSIAVEEISTSHSESLKEFLLLHGSPLEELFVKFDSFKPMFGVGSLIQTIRTNCPTLSKLYVSGNFNPCTEAMRDYVCERGHALKCLKVNSIIGNIDLLFDVVKHCKQLELLEMKVLRLTDFLESEKIWRMFASLPKLNRAKITIYDCDLVDGKMTVHGPDESETVTYCNQRHSVMKKEASPWKCRVGF